MITREQFLADALRGQEHTCNETCLGCVRVGAREERAAIVAWLRKPRRYGEKLVFEGADEIERGEHTKEGG